MVNKSNMFNYVLLTLILFVLGIIAIDTNRMVNGKSVRFSNWGINYPPQADLSDLYITKAIEDYLVKKRDSQPKYPDTPEGVKHFAVVEIYSVLEKDNKYEASVWVLLESNYLDNGEIKNRGVSSGPSKFILEKKDDHFTVVEAFIPRGEGPGYQEDVQKFFSSEFKKDMYKIHLDGTYSKLRFRMNEKVNLYFHK